VAALVRPCWESSESEERDREGEEGDEEQELSGESRIRLDSFWLK
jgi:hypothetical protein